jgi:hypothetical protein
LLAFLFDSKEITFKGQFGELIGNKSKKPYWGIRWDMGHGDYINYAITLGDFRILERLNIFKLREGA